MKTLIKSLLACLVLFSVGNCGGGGTTPEDVLSPSQLVEQAKGIEIDDESKLLDEILESVSAMMPPKNEHKSVRPGKVSMTQMFLGEGASEKKGLIIDLIKQYKVLLKDDPSYSQAINSIRDAVADLNSLLEDYRKLLAKALKIDKSKLKTLADTAKALMED